jgi:3',5'-cyclic AMP phosphodiesterase CpdA
VVYRLAQISDTHLSRDKPFFVANFNQVAAHLAAERPDLVVNTGDLALDGAHGRDDLAEARRLHDTIGLTVRFIPGNHDVGESPDVPAKEQPIITAEARARYLRLFGDDFWLLDVPGWRIVAVNAQLLGSALPAADAQLAFLGAAVAGAQARSLALLVHKPLFHLSSDEAAITGRFVNPGPRRRLLAAFAGRRPALIASGHVHQYLSATLEGSAHVWCPSTGFILPDSHQPRYGLKQTGYVEHALAADGSHASRLVAVPDLATLNIADFPEAYGPLV